MTAFLATLTTGGHWARAGRRVRGRGGLHRLCAWLLVALVAAPFTSPFSTCDLRALSATITPAAMHRIVPPLSTGAVLIAARDTDGGPVSIEEETFKDDVVTSDVDLSLELPAERTVSRPEPSATSVARTLLVALRL